MNPVPTLEEEKGDDGEPHTFSNESSSYDSLLNVCGSPSSPSSSSSVRTGFITERMWSPIISLFFFQCKNWDDGEPHTFSNESSSYTGRRGR
jgi:hypothetical protein